MHEWEKLKQNRNVSGQTRKYKYEQLNLWKNKLPPQSRIISGVL